MKLYELQRGTWFTLAETPEIPPSAQKPVAGRYKLHNIDGMYSYVTDEDGNVYHFAAWTEVNKED